MKREAEVPLPPQAVIGMMNRAWGTRSCMHPEASPELCNQVIDAHTVGRAMALRHVIDESNHALSFMTASRGKDGLPNPGRIGWRRASTITGFCGKHDAETFRSLEGVPFTGTPEQCFLLAYRAACYELFQKTGALKSAPVVRRLADRGRKVSEQAQIQGLLDIIGRATAAGARDLREIKADLDRSLVAGDWNAVQSLVVRVDGTIDVVTGGGASPKETMDGEAIQELADLDVRLQEVYLNVVPDPDGSGGWYIFGWRRGCGAAERFITSLERVPSESLPDVLVQLQFVFYENSFFRASWWANLNDAARDLIRSAMLITDGSASKAMMVKGGVARFRVRGLNRVPAAV